MSYSWIKISIIIGPKLKIVQDYCHDTKITVKEKGKKVKIIYGQTWKTFDQCMQLHMMTVLKHADAAESQHYYMMNHVKKPNKMSMLAFCLRIIDLNNYLLYLLCHEDVPDTPRSGIPHVNKKLPELELCTLILKNSRPCCVMLQIGIGKLIPRHFQLILQLSLITSRKLILRP